jgi:hypothetical protein
MTSLAPKPTDVVVTSLNFDFQAIKQIIEEKQLLGRG